VVVSGGTCGIGAATIERLYRDQANVVFGDSDEEAAKRLVGILTSEDSERGEVTFVNCDVTKHTGVYGLFHTAFNRYGHVHHAFAIAYILEQGNWFPPELDIASVEHAEETAVLDVNMKGTAVFARIAIVFLRTGMRPKENRSLTFTSSVAGIQDLPGSYMYQSSQYGILGLMRSMRKIIYERDGIRVNCICPGMTNFSTTASATDTLHIQNSDDCARFYLGVANNPGINGKSILVEGGKGWEFEDGLRKTMSQWLGEEPTKMLRENMKAVGKGSNSMLG